MSPGRQRSTHLTLQLRGFAVAAEDGSSLALQHALQGSTLCPTHSHQQHLLPTCATQGKTFSRPQRRARAPAAAWSSPQATHGCRTAEGAAKGLRTGQCCVPAQPQQLCQQGSSPAARAGTPTTGPKELPGESLNSSSQILFFWLSGILHKSFHSCLLLSTFNLPSTVLLQKSSFQ